MLVVGTGRRPSLVRGSVPPLQDPPPAPPRGRLTRGPFAQQLLRISRLTAECEPSAGAPAGKLALGVSEYRSENAVMK